MEPSPVRSRLAAPALLAAALLLAGCPKAAPPGPGGPAPAAAHPADAEVRAALARRPDLAANRVFVLGMDGLDPDLVRERIEKGRCPNFERLLREGATGPLRSQAPMLSPLLWTTIATGQFPTEHGVLDFMVRDEKDPEKRQSVTSAHRTVEAMWDIAGRYGRTVGLVGWLASHPAEKVNGFAVSERNELLAYLFHQSVEPSPEGKTWPPELVARVNTLRRAPSSVTFEEMKPFLGDVSAERYAAACQKDEFDNDNRTNAMRLIWTATENFRRVGTTLYREKKPDLFCTYYEEIDAVAHFAMAYREPITWKKRPVEEVVKMICPPEDEAEKAPRQKSLPADLVRAIALRSQGEGADGPPIEIPQDLQEAFVRQRPLILELAQGAEPEKVKRWGGAVDASYDHADAILGEAMAMIDDRTILVVLSDHGWAFGEGKPPFDSSFRSRLGGAEFHRMDGFLGLWGKGVKKGMAIQPWRPKPNLVGARLVDVSPTVLALMGLPKAKDMPGRVLAECFDLDLQTGAVDTYERGRAQRLARESVERRERIRATSGEDRTEASELQGAMKALEAVGYVGTAEEGPGRALMHTVASFVEQERYDEAEEALREFLKTADAETARAARFQLGTVLLKKQDLAGAERAFRDLLATARRKDPPDVLFNLAMVLDARGDTAAALDCWERLVRVEPKNPVFKVQLARKLRESTRREDPGRAAVLARGLALVDEAAKAGEGGGSGLAPGGLNERGMLLIELGRYEEARVDLAEAARRAKDYEKPRTNLGVLEMRLASAALGEAQATADPARREALLAAYGARREEALRMFQEALAINSGNPKARCNRAEILARLPPQDLAEAERELDQALLDDPNYRRAKDLREWVRAERAKGGAREDGR